MNCDNCNSHIKRWTYLWSNGHGNKKRYFCHNCGQWTDVKHMYQLNTLTKEIRKKGQLIPDF